MNLLHNSILEFRNFVAVWIFCFQVKIWDETILTISPFLVLHILLISNICRISPLLSPNLFTLQSIYLPSSLFFFRTYLLFLSKLWKPAINAFLIFWRLNFFKSFCAIIFSNLSEVFLLFFFKKTIVHELYLFSKIYIPF